MAILSLIIPAYNVSNYIDDCITSIYNQKIDKSLFEVIVINDGSTDDTLDVLSKYKYDNISIYNQVNQGLSVTRNKGVELSQGRYVWFIDSDDWLLPNSLELVLKYIDEYPDNNLFSSVLLEYYELNKVKKLEFVPSKFIFHNHDYLKNKYPSGASQRFIIKKDFMLSNNLTFYPGILHEDGLFGNQLLYLSKDVILLSAPVYCYRIRVSNSIMSSLKIKSAYDLIFIHKELIRFMNNKVSVDDKQWYRYIVSHILFTIFHFFRGKINSSEFKVFYSRNRDYIRDETKFLNKSFNWRLRRIILLYSPFLYSELIYIVKKIKRRC